MFSFASSLKADQTQLAQPPLMYRVLQALDYLDDFCWTQSCMSMSLMYWGAHKCTQHPRTGLTTAEQRRRNTSLPSLPPLLMQHAVGLFYFKCTLLALVSTCTLRPLGTFLVFTYSF